MGHPASPLLLLLLLLHPATSSPCFEVPADAPAELDLANRSHHCTELDWSIFQRQRRLLLSRNGIQALSPSSRVAPELEELDLSHNRLRELPAAFLGHARGLRRLQLQHNQLHALHDGFFANTSALQSLQLEGNPLAAVPSSAFHASLRSLAVPCRCDTVGSILTRCARAPRLQCHCCLDHRVFLNVTDFHAQQCWHGVGLVAGMAGAAVGVAVVLAVAAVLCYRRRKVATAGVGWAKREPSMAHGQTRYISRGSEMGTSEAAAAAAPDYENVFVSPCAAPAAAQGWTPAWQEESPQVPVDDDYFLDVAPGEQPIYANTQNPNDDNIYIVPNQ
ncbi:leucine-rich repeat-containing protein 25 isoform X2 [Cuculus canorus]|uniref:leucine-rich repeat-containing protein 25 isoform X2 n=1 Tax=Cuculus canorus TaxID=55661 RepID=UPI0023AAE057|nr:leucine-rich repeat-containing protein 25 isoform X2 [Cuculus canorus]